MFYVIPYKDYKDAMCCDGTDCVIEEVQKQIDSDKLYIQDTDDLVVETVDRGKLFYLLSLRGTTVEGLDVTENDISIVCEDFDCFYSEDSMSITYGDITLDRSNGLRVFKEGFCKASIDIKLVRETNDVYTWLVSTSAKKYYKLITTTDTICIEGVQFIKTKRGYTFIGFFSADDYGAEIINIGVSFDDSLNLKSIDCAYFYELSKAELHSYAKSKLLGGI